MSKPARANLSVQRDGFRALGPVRSSISQSLANEALRENIGTLAIFDAASGTVRVTEVELSDIAVKVLFTAAENLRTVALSPLRPAGALRPGLPKVGYECSRADRQCVGNSPED